VRKEKNDPEQKTPKTSEEQRMDWLARMKQINSQENQKVRMAKHDEIEAVQSVPVPQPATQSAQVQTPAALKRTSQISNQISSKRRKVAAESPVADSSLAKHEQENKKKKEEKMEDWRRRMDEVNSEMT
jgi:hypothetical protein